MVPVPSPQHLGHWTVPGPVQGGGLERGRPGRVHATKVQAWTTVMVSAGAGAQGLAGGPERGAQGRPLLSARHRAGSWEGGETPVTTVTWHVFCVWKGGGWQPALGYRARGPPLGSYVAGTVPELCLLTWAQCPSPS